MRVYKMTYVLRTDNATSMAKLEAAAIAAMATIYGKLAEHAVQPIMSLDIGEVDYIHADLGAQDAQTN